MGPLDLITNAHAATTENAAVVVNGEELVGGIHRAVGVLVGETGVVHTHRHCYVLQFAGAIGYAEGAHMVAFGKKQLHCHAA